MQPNSVIYPPNRPLERLVKQPTTPVLEEYLFFIDFNSKGDAIISSSDVSGTGWYGSVFYFKDSADALNLKFDAHYTASCCISDGLFYGDNHIIVATDNKFLNLLNVEEGSEQLCETFFVETPDITNQIAVSAGESRIVTGAGNCVSLWHVGEDFKITSLQEYRNYHAGIVTSVDIDKTRPNVFYSASLDKRACMWDERSPSPASLLYVNEFSSLRSIACSPSQPNIVAVASAAGDVYLLDVREPMEFITVIHCMNESLHKIRFNDSKYLAVCGNSTDVFVVNTEDNKVVHQNNEHKGIVRGLAWYEDDLYSCGFGKSIIKHKL